jgi:hypothetical protein
MADAIVDEILRLNQRLLESIADGDWETYAKLCDPTLTAFEPEALGQLIEGMDFHQFYFKLGGAKRQRHTTMCSPKVRVMGEVAVIAYVRLNQRLSGEPGIPVTSGYEETRVWERQNGAWKHVHFHRSPLAAC